MKLLDRPADGRKVIFFLVAANLVYIYMLLVTIPQLTEFAGGMKIFDMMPFGYDQPYAMKLLRALGPDGRYLYSARQLPADMFYPLLSGIAYHSLLIWLLHKMGRNGKPVMYLALVPLAAALFDYMENFSVILMISQYPRLAVWHVGVASAFTLVKSMLWSIAYTSLIVVLVLFLFRKIRPARERDG